MSVWTATQIAILLIVVLLCSGFIVLFARRRWLSTRGGVFYCELRTPDDQGNGVWANGLARYQGNSLEWYRIISLSFSPRVVLQRNRSRLIDHRPPARHDSLVLFTGHEIVRIESLSSSGTPRSWELGMDMESLTGFMSWLEASPPGGDTYGEFN